MGPPKSYSQPSHLTALAEHSSSQSSLDSLDTTGPVDPLLALPSKLEEEETDAAKSQVDPIESETKKKKKRGLKHSLSSLFPFSSSSTVAPSPVIVDKRDAVVTGKETAFMDHFRWDTQSQKEKDNLENDVIICDDDISDVGKPVLWSVCFKYGKWWLMRFFYVLDERWRGGAIPVWRVRQSLPHTNPLGCPQKEETSLRVSHRNIWFCTLHLLLWSLLIIIPTMLGIFCGNRCADCDSVFPTQEILDCHQQQMCQYDYVSEHEELNNFLDLGSEQLRTGHGHEEQRQLLDRLTLCTPRSAGTMQWLLLRGSAPFFQQRGWPALKRRNQYCSHLRENNILFSPDCYIPAIC